MQVSTTKTEGNLCIMRFRFWSGYLHQPKKYYNDSLNHNLSYFWRGGRPSEIDRRSVVERSLTGRRSVAKMRSPTCPQSVGNQSPTNCKPYWRLLCDLYDRYGFWSRRGRRAVAGYVRLRLYTQMRRNVHVRTIPLFTIYFFFYQQILL